MLNFWDLIKSISLSFTVSCIICSKFSAKLFLKLLLIRNNVLTFVPERYEIINISINKYRNKQLKNKRI